VQIVSHEPLLRLGCFVGVLLAMALWEVLAPRRRLNVDRPWRWTSNLGLVVIGTLAVRLVVPVGAVGVAVFAEEQGWGLLHGAEVPAWVAVPVAIVALDLVIYLQHVMFHAVPLFWRLHMVHHADLDFDATTGIRFHPLEIILSLLIKAAAVLLIGVPALAVLLFEMLLNATSLFNHGNVQLPSWLDRVLRLVFVTPDMHRVHHSADGRETNSNFGFNLSWWDFLFGTYLREPAAGHEHMTIGLSQLRDEQRADRLHWMLLLPFFGRYGPYPVNRRARANTACDPDSVETAATTQHADEPIGAGR
jgi:sterol desaturase/sphingolipid hydroxylase (fatty acid hydroxylase superfamily)